MALRTQLVNTRITPRFAGICTFCRYPRLEEVAPEARPVDWAVYGVPFDSGVTFRPGARFGPRAVRDASQYVKPYHIEHDVNVAEVFSLADGGDSPVRPYSLKENADVVASFAASLADPSTRLLAVGGDHSIAYANIKAAWQRRQQAGGGGGKGGLPVIHFDSHLDTVDTVWGEKWGHASPFIRAIEDGLIDPTRMISIGIKGPLNTRDDLQYAKDKGITVVSPDRWRAEGAKLAAEFLAKLKGEPAYLTFDIDVVDPAFAPGTGTPSVGGLTSGEALSAVRAFKGVKLAGADVVEVLPDRDVSDITAFLAAHIVFEVIALDAAGR